MSKLIACLAVPILALSVSAQNVVRVPVAARMGAPVAGAMSVLIPNMARPLNIDTSGSRAIGATMYPALSFMQSIQVKSGSKRSRMPEDRPSRKPGPDDTDLYDDMGNQRRDDGRDGPDSTSDGSDNDRGGNDSLFMSPLKHIGSFAQLEALAMNGSGAMDGLSFKKKDKSERPSGPKTPGNNRGSGSGSNDRNSGSGRGGDVNGDRWGRGDGNGSR